MSSVRRPLALALALVLTTAAACGGGSRHTVGPATTTPMTVAPTTTTSAPPTTTTTVDPHVEPADAAAAAEAVTAAERAIRAGDADEAWGVHQQVAYRTLVVHPDWVPAAIDRVPPELRAAVQANVDAGTKLRQLTQPKATLPPWRIVAPAPTAELLADYKAAERETGVPWTYLAAIHLVETKIGRIRGPSDKGAQGPMQFLPATWSQYGNGGDINSNRDAIAAAARLLRHNGAPSRMAAALYSYNHSQLYVDAVTAYAGVMAADERAYAGYHAWEVYYRLQTGDRLLPVGFVNTT